MIHSDCITGIKPCKCPSSSVVVRLLKFHRTQTVLECFFWVYIAWCTTIKLKTNWFLSDINCCIQAFRKFICHNWVYFQSGLQINCQNVIIVWKIFIIVINIFKVRSWTRLFGFANRGAMIELVTDGAFFAICQTFSPFVFCSTISAFYLALFLWLNFMLRIWTAFIDSVASITLFRSFESSLTRHTCKHLSRSRSTTLSRSSHSVELRIPPIILMWISESWSIPKLHVAANNFKSITNLSIDSPSSWIQVKNFYLATVSFFFRFQCSSKTFITSCNVRSSLAFSKCRVSYISRPLLPIT